LEIKPTDIGMARRRLLQTGLNNHTRAKTRILDKMSVWQMIKRSTPIHNIGWTESKTRMSTTMPPKTHRRLCRMNKTPNRRGNLWKRVREIVWKGRLRILLRICSHHPRLYCRRLKEDTRERPSSRYRTSFGD
jgi:hypothetical protein